VRQPEVHTLHDGTDDDQDPRVESELAAIEAAAALIGVDVFNMAVAKANLVAKRIMPTEPRMMHT
jgi:hypothetical protein